MDGPRNSAGDLLSRASDGSVDLRLKFDPTFDRGAWPPVLFGTSRESGIGHDITTVPPSRLPVADVSAVLGEANVGMMGLLSSLETALGLTGAYPTRVERLAWVVRRLQEVDGAWSRSAATDPLGTAAALLRQRDDLWMEGWRGQPYSARLHELADVAAGAPPGIADRFQAVDECLRGRRSRRPPHLHVSFLEPVYDLPGTLRSICRQLEEVSRAQSLPSPGPADGHVPDVFLLRCHGPLVAAEEVAAWLASLPSLSDVVIIGCDPILDSGLSRFGLPMTGSLGASGASGLGSPAPVAEVLDLAMQLAWGPCDPDAALELLLVPDGPVPPGLAGRLADALHTWPAVDSAAWREAVKAALDAMPEGRRADVLKRIDVLFTPTAEHGRACDKGDLLRRLDTVERWALQRSHVRPQESSPTLPRVPSDTPPGPIRTTASNDAAAAADDLPAPWADVLGQVHGFRLLVEALNKSSLSQADLRRLLLASATGGAGRQVNAEAGVHSVGDPGAVSGPVSQVVWWDFTRRSESIASGPVVSREEQRRLEADGIRIASSGERALARAARYRRPWEFAASLVLVCPERDARGDEAHPHPLWDEITAGMGEAERSTLSGRRLGPPRGRSVQVEPTRRPSEAFEKRAEPLRSPRPRETAPRPQREWALAPEIPLRSPASPSSLGRLLGCSLQWWLKDRMSVRAGRTELLPSAQRLVGSVAHELIGRILEQRPTDPHAAAQAAQELFDEIGSTLAAPLFMPGAEASKAEVRDIVSDATYGLVSILRRSQMVVVGVEERVSGDTEIGPIEGRADLLVARRPDETRVAAVVDLKLGGSRYRLEEMKAGTGLQLATYANLLGRVDDHGRRVIPDVAYFVLRDGRLLAGADGVFQGAEHIAGPSAAQTWGWTVTAVERRREELAVGQLLAPGNPNAAGEIDPEESGIHPETGLVLTAPCLFCDVPQLCGRMFAGGEP